MFTTYRNTKLVPTNIKLNNFGLSTYFHYLLKTNTSPASNLMHTAPEYLQNPNAPFEPSADIWWIGLILYQLIFGAFPFKTQGLDIKPILQGNLKFDVRVRVTTEVKDLLTKLMCKDPLSRLDMFSVLNHPWFTLTDQEISDAATVPKFIDIDSKYLSNRKLALSGLEGILSKSSIMNLRNLIVQKAKDYDISSNFMEPPDGHSCHVLVVKNKVYQKFTRKLFGKFHKKSKFHHRQKVWFYLDLIRY